MVMEENKPADKTRLSAVLILLRNRLLRQLRFI